jgi:hypothetical protein
VRYRAEGVIGPTPSTGEFAEPLEHAGDRRPVRARAAAAVPETAEELTSPESLIGTAGPAPLTVARDHTQIEVPAARRRWISKVAIDLSAQTIQYEWSDKKPGGSGPISSGRGTPCTTGEPCANQDNENCTPTGRFNPLFRGGAGYTSTKGDHMSWYVDLGTGRGIGTHNAQPVRGVPASHGCIRVHDAMARRINQNVITTTLVATSGKAPTAAWRDRTCPAPRRRR